MAQFSPQVIYLSLHGLFIILSLGYVTSNFFQLHGPVVILSLECVATHTRMASAGLGGVRISLSKLHFDHAQGWGSYPVAGI